MTAPINAGSSGFSPTDAAAAARTDRGDTAARRPSAGAAEPTSTGTRTGVPVRFNLPPGPRSDGLLSAADLPADGRFGAGPSRIRPEQMADLLARSQTWLGTSHRQLPVRQLVGELREGLAEFFGLPADYVVVLGNGGATAFWDIACANLIRQRAQHVVVGEFSAKFAAAAAAAPFLADPEVLRAEPGSGACAHPAEDIDAYAWPHNETSTGVMLPVERVAGAHDALVLVDGTSAAGGLRLDVREVDAYYFAPQKCFGSDGGLWFALLSPAAVERAEQVATDGRWVPSILDLRAAIDNSRHDQTLNTPSLATLALMHSQVQWLNEHGGMDWAADRCAGSARTVYSWAEGRAVAEPFVSDPSLRSDVVATIDLAQGVDATEVTGILREHGIVDLEPYRKLGRNQLRIGCYPSVEPADIAALTRCIDTVVAELGGR